MEKMTLPYVGQSGCYEMRLESIGGLGANLCGKLLGELGAKYLGLNAAAFSSYGSEKRGSPVHSYVRLCDSGQEILHNSPVEQPQLLVLFHASLPSETRGDITVINTKHMPRGLCGTVCTVDALSLALECKSRVNMVMLGAIARASGFIPLEAVKAIITDTLGKKYPDMLQGNLAGAQLGFERLKTHRFEHADTPPARTEKPRWGYANAPIGGVNPHFGSTVANDLSPSREGYVPLFLPEKCIHCGLCDTTCPDMVFQFTAGEYRGRRCMVNRGLDYMHCKGCLRCVDVCPTEALVRGEDGSHTRHFVYDRDLITKNIDFVPSGADPSVTGESYLDQKREDGGLM